MTKPENKPFDVFWGEISPCEHLVQIYATDDVFLDSLEGFVYSGLRAGEGVIVIATSAHLGALKDRLTERKVDLDAAQASDQYIPVQAQWALGQFLEGSWPNDELFKRFVTGLMTRASKGGRRVRAFGEMVAVLWAEGHNAATVRLEHLWHSLCQEQAFSVFCAYPRIGFTDNFESSIKEICETHSRLVS